MTSQSVRFQTSLEKYEETQENIRKLLRQIAAGLEAHNRNAGSLPGGHNWGHAGDLVAIEEALRDVKDRLHNTGEYKKA